MKMSVRAAALGAALIIALGALVLPVTVISAVSPAQVAYDANGGAGAALTLNKTAGDVVAAAPQDTYAPPAGKVFRYWHTAKTGVGGRAYAPGAPVTVPEGGVTLYAVWEDADVNAERHGLQVVTLSGGAVSLNGGPSALSAMYSMDYMTGCALRLEASADTGYAFAYWMNLKNSSVITDEPVLDMYMGAGIGVMAVFFRTGEAGSGFTVTFVDKCGKTLQSTGVAKGGSVAPPAAPAIFGYSFTGWSRAAENVTSDMIITALYARNPDRYAVSVTNGTLMTGAATGDFRYDTKVTVSADAAPAGMKFSHWEQDGQKVGTSASFAFFTPLRDTRLTAVYVASGAVLDDIPFITLSEQVLVNSTAGDIMFTATVSLPAGYAPVERGVLLLKSASPVSELTLGTAGAIIGRALRADGNQFNIMKSEVESGDTWYGRAYLIYMDADGNAYTVYSGNIEHGAV